MKTCDYVAEPGQCVGGCQEGEGKRGPNHHPASLQHHLKYYKDLSLLTLLLVFLKKTLM